jgi:hypothetical protein
MFVGQHPPPSKVIFAVISSSISNEHEENVGRHGMFPSGIACNTIADYFSIGNIAQAYKHVALKIGEERHYTDAMISHLLSLKVMLDWTLNAHCY